MISYLSVMAMMTLLCRGEFHPNPSLSGKEIIGKLAKQYEQIASLFVEYDVYGKLGGDKRRWLTVLEWAARDLHYTSIIHWYDSRLYPVDSSGSNDQASNWFLWTPSRSIQCFVNKRHCYTWDHLPSAQRNPGFRFYSAIIGCLPPQLKLHSSSRISDMELDSEIPPDILYFPRLLSTENWNCQQSCDGRYKYTKRSGTFQMTMLFSADGPKLLERQFLKDDFSSLVIKYSKHKSFNEVWLPYCISIDKKGMIQREMIIKQVSLNDEEYAAQAITLTLPPGTMITTDRKKPNTGFVTGGADLLEDLLARSCDAGLHWNETHLREPVVGQTIFVCKVDLWVWRILSFGCGFAFGGFWQRLRGTYLL